MNQFPSDLLYGALPKRGHDKAREASVPLTSKLSFPPSARGTYSCHS